MAEPLKGSKAHVDELLDAVQDQGRMDLIDDFAFPLPATVISEMLGIPPSDRDQFGAWASGILSFQATARPSAEAVFRAQDSIREARAYFADLFEQRRHDPVDDLVSGLVAAEEQGDKLSEAELMNTCVTLLTGGHETTTGLIANAVAFEFSGTDAKIERRSIADIWCGGRDVALRGTIAARASTGGHRHQDSRYTNPARRFANSIVQRR